MTVKNVFISSGEPSGDLLAAGAVAYTNELLKGCCRIDWHGMAGERMIAAGVQPLKGIKPPAVAGLWELLPRAGEILRFRREFYRQALSRKWDLAVLVDLPDLHLPLGRKLRVKGVPVLQYVPPQAWAWRSGRSESLRISAERTAVLFPFEKEYFKKRGVKVSYVGHPLLDKWIQSEENAATPAKSKKQIALLPGSRRHEIEGMARTMLDACRLISKTLPETPTFHMVAAQGSRKLVEQTLKPGDAVAIVERDAVNFCEYDLAICAAGSVTLELAAANVPFIMAHRIHPVSYRLLKGRMNTGLIALPNILAGYMAAPELLQDECRPERITDESAEILMQGGAQKQKAAWLALGRSLTAIRPDMRIENLIADMLDM